MRTQGRRESLKERLRGLNFSCPNIPGFNEEKLIEFCLANAPKRYTHVVVGIVDLETSRLDKVTLRSALVQAETLSWCREFQPRRKQSLRAIEIIELLSGLRHRIYCTNCEKLGHSIEYCTESTGIEQIKEVWRGQVAQGVYPK